MTAFKRELKAVFDHAYASSPQFKRKTEIDLESISFFSLAIATLMADIESLFKEFAGLRLPTVKGVPGSVKDSAKLESLNHLFKKYAEFQKEARDSGSDEEGENAPLEFNPLPLEEDGDVEEDMVVLSEEFWSLVFAQVRKTFPVHHKAISSFINWHFQPEIEPEEIDWRIRPPVGEAFGQFIRSIQGPRAGAQSGRSGRFVREGQSGSRGPSDRGSGRSSGNGGRTTERSARDGRGDSRQARGSASGSSASRSGREFDERGRDRNRTAPERGTRSRRPQADEGNGGRSEAETEEMSQAALQDLERNIRILQKNSRRPGIRLKPQNSFFRRIQHMHAKEMGYETESVGEAKDRCVFVKNKE